MHFLQSFNIFILCLYSVPEKCKVLIIVLYYLCTACQWLATGRWFRVSVTCWWFCVLATCDKLMLLCVSDLWQVDDFMCQWLLAVWWFCVSVACDRSEFCVLVTFNRLVVLCVSDLPQVSVIETLLKVV